jgi:hypothetical protein
LTLDQITSYNPYLGRISEGEKPKEES